MPRVRGSALVHGCGRGGRVALPLARAAAVSTCLGCLASIEPAEPSLMMVCHLAT